MGLPFEASLFFRHLWWTVPCSIESKKKLLKKLHNTQSFVNNLQTRFVAAMSTNYIYRNLHSRKPMHFDTITLRTCNKDANGKMETLQAAPNTYYTGVMMHGQWLIAYSFQVVPQYLYILDTYSWLSWLGWGDHWNDKLRNKLKDSGKNKKVSSATDPLSFILCAPLSSISRILLCSCSVCVAEKIEVKQRLCDQGPKYPEHRERGKSTRLRIASCSPGAFLSRSTVYYHCPSALSFFPPKVKQQASTTSLTATLATPD